MLKLSVKVTNSGRFLLKPKITTHTFDHSLQSTISNIYLRTNADLTISNVVRKSNSYKITIKNKGGLSSKPTYLKIYYKLGKKTISKIFKVKGIDAGKSTIINAKFFKHYKHKKYTKTIHVNYNKRINEANYKNNQKKFR